MCLSRRYSISHHVLVGISVAMHSEPLMILLHNSIIFFTFSQTMSFTKPTKKETNQGSQIWRKRKPREWDPSSYLTIRKLPVQKGMNTTGEVRWYTILTGKLFPQKHNTKQCYLHHSQKSVTTHTAGSLKKRLLSFY